MFGLIAQGNTSVTAGAENALTTVADPDITTQNGQFIFTGPFNLLSEMMIGASVQFGRYNVAQWNGRGQPRIFAANRNANPTAPMFWGDYRTQPAPLPQNQQIQALITNNLSMGNEAETLLWRISTPDWSMNLPTVQWTMIARATATVTPVVGSWVLSNAITFDQVPLGGVYAVLGANCEGANGLAYRIVFPRTRLYQGRRLRPGGVILSNFGQLPSLFGQSEFGSMGVWGAFHTFEPPTLDILGTTASSTVFTVFLKIGYMGESVSLLDNFINTNY